MQELTRSVGMEILAPVVVQEEETTVPVWNAEQGTWSDWFWPGCKGATTRCPGRYVNYLHTLPAVFWLGDFLNNIKARMFKSCKHPPSPSPPKYFFHFLWETEQRKSRERETKHRRNGRSLWKGATVTDGRCNDRQLTRADPADLKHRRGPTWSHSSLNTW